MRGRVKDSGNADIEPTDNVHRCMAFFCKTVQAFNEKVPILTNDMLLAPE